MTPLIFHHYRPQTKFAKVVFHRSLSVHRGWGLYPGGVSVHRGLCPGESLSRGVSVQWGSLSRGVSVQGSLCPGESLSRGVSVREIPPYGYVRAVPIPLEYTLVVKGDCFLGNFSQMPYIFLMASTRL